MHFDVFFRLFKGPTQAFTFKHLRADSFSDVNVPQQKCLIVSVLKKRALMFFRVFYLIIEAQLSVDFSRAPPPGKKDADITKNSYDS